MRKLLIITGAIILAAGILWPWLGRIPFGRLPGDIIISRPGFRLFFPLTSMIIVSVIISILIWFFRK